MSRRGSRKRKERRQPRADLRKKKQLRKCCEPKKPALKAPPPPAQPCTKTASNIVWENIVLHYLYKLKNAWKSTPNEVNQAKCKDIENLSKDKKPISKSRHVKVESRASTPSKVASKEKNADPSRESKSQNSFLSVGQNSYNSAKRKAINIVRNAIDYGHSKGIISKNGKFFWLKDDMQIEPKVDQDCTCIHCKACRNKIKTKSCCSSTIPSRYKEYKAKSRIPNVYEKSKMRAYFEEDSDND